MHVLLGKVSQNKRPFFWGKFVFLHPELLQQLPAGDCKDGLEETAAEHLTRLIARQAVVTLRDMTVAQPPVETYAHPLEHYCNARWLN